MLSKLCDDLRWIAEFQDIPYYREIILDAVDTIETLLADKPTGKWVPNKIMPHICLDCPECGYHHIQVMNTANSFCPNCGAMMEV